MSTASVPFRLLRSLLFLLCFLSLAPSARAEDWVRVRSAHFEVLSDASPQRAREVTVALERFRRVMAAVLGRGPGGGDPPIVVVAFRDQDSFAPLRPLYRGRSQEVEGYFQAGSDRDYIAVSLGADAKEASETLEVTFTCGAQREPVTARYRPLPVPSPDGADGTLRSLTFESR